MHVHTYAYIYTDHCTAVHIHTHTHKQVNIQAQPNNDACTYPYIHAYIHTCRLTYLRTYTFAHFNLKRHNYIHIHLHVSVWAYNSLWQCMRSMHYAITSIFCLYWLIRVCVWIVMWRHITTPSTDCRWFWVGHANRGCQRREVGPDCSGLQCVGSLALPTLPVLT